MVKELSLLSEAQGKEALRGLDSELSTRAAVERVVDLREATGYQVAVVLMNATEQSKLFLKVDFDKGDTIPVPPIELRPPTEHVPNRVKDALDHPFAYMAAAGIATEALFDRKDIAA